MTKGDVSFSDKYLIDQPEHRHFYNGDDFHVDLFNLVMRSSGISNPHEEFDLEYTDMFSVEEMASNPVSLRFLEFIIAISGAKRILEIGAFIGVSTMAFAKALPEVGKVVSIEKFDHFAEIARRNFERNGLSNKINLIEGDAGEVIGNLPRDELFDIVFIDGNKERYKDYMMMTESLLAPRGIMIVDDVFFHGDAVNKKPTDAKGQGARDTLDYAATMDDWLRISLPLANGILMMVRK